MKSESKVYSHSNSHCSLSPYTSTTLTRNYTKPRYAQKINKKRYGMIKEYPLLPSNTKNLPANKKNWLQKNFSRCPSKTYKTPHVRRKFLTFGSIIRPSDYPRIQQMQRIRKQRERRQTRATTPSLCDHS